MSANPNLITERDGHVLVVTLNRPDKLNAFTPEMMTGLADAWEQLNEDDELRVGVLTGAGGNFCAGADLKAMTTSHPGDSFGDEDGGDGGEREAPAPDQDPPWVMRGLLRGYRLKKPLIAAVEGVAVAGGTEILQATDIRVAAESARFGVSEVRWGLFPLGGSTVRLRRQISYTEAADILLTGRHLRAAEAKEIGLVGYVVPDGEALDKARELAHLVASNGPLAVQAVLRSLRETEGLPENEALEIEYAIGTRVFKTEDAKIGPQAFMEKRPPEFVGR